MIVLAGDIGGTKCLLRLARVHAAGNGPHETLYEQRYTSAEFTRFEDLVRRFLHEAHSREPIAAACLAVAGPVEGADGHRRARLTNLPWVLDNELLAEEFEIARVDIVNDFAAIAYSLPLLREDELATLQAGRHVAGAPVLIAGAGTGLGVCALCPEGELVMATEGGHAGFAPTDAQQCRLLAFVSAREGRCTREHLLSGRGLVRILEFLEQDGGHPRSEALAQAMAEGDPAAAVSEFGLCGRDGLASQALGLFAHIYGSQLGDLALTFLARGGVYVAGGIAPKILPLLRGPEFLAAFLDKAPMRHVVEVMPVHVILNPATGLLGAVGRAAALGRALAQAEAAG